MRRAQGAAPGAAAEAPVGCTNAIFLQAADFGPTGITVASDG
jgi:hypothetical protein